MTTPHEQARWQRLDAQAELATLRAELQRMTEERDSQRAWINRITDNTNSIAAMRVQLSKAEAALRDREAQMADALVKYGDHLTDCDVVTGKGMGLSENIIVRPKCSCGYSTLLTSPEKADGK